MSEKPASGAAGWFRTPMGTAALGGAVLLALYLTIWHTTHFVQALPFLLLLACPLMHLFMHGGHSGHGAQGQHGVGGDRVADIRAEHTPHSVHAAHDDPGEGPNAHPDAGHDDSRITTRGMDRPEEWGPR